MIEFNGLALIVAGLFSLNNRLMGLRNVMQIMSTANISRYRLWRWRNVMYAMA